MVILSLRRLLAVCLFSWGPSSINPKQTLLQWQGRSEVGFFIADPIFVQNFVILDSKSVQILDSDPTKYGTAWSCQIRNKTTNPDPMACDPWSRGCDDVTKIRQNF